MPPSHLALLLLVLSTACSACACTIPVFRYALDRWPADPLELQLPPAIAAQTDVADLLRPLRASGHANLKITTDTQVQQPTLVSPQAAASLWSGPLDATALSQILDSPARTRLIQQILQGDSVIWVLVTDDSPASRSQVTQIEKRLSFLQQVAALPLQDPNDPDSRLGPGPPLKLAFTVLTLSLTDPAEAIFIEMLRGPGQTPPNQQTFAAAVFGRGRVLGSWPLEEVDDQLLEEASMFLIGRCSCRIKDQNPGWDLLLNVAWENELQQIGTNQTPDTSPPSPTDSAPTDSAPTDSAPTDSAPATTAQPETVTLRPNTAAAATPAQPASYVPWPAIGAALLLLAFLAIKARRPKP